MTTLADQVSSLTIQVNLLQSLLMGARDQGKWYSMIGDTVIFGCKVTAGYSASDMVLALDSTADAAHVNPDRSVTPVRHEQYGNIALIYGEPFFSTDINTASLQNSALTVSTAPSAGYHRYDIVYVYVGSGGPAISIAAGTPVLNASTPTDPTIPTGALAIARVHVQENVTGITNSAITDLRQFGSRLTKQESVYEPAAGTAFTVDLAKGNVQKFTTAGSTTVTLPSSVAGKTYKVIVSYGGAHSLSFAGGSVLKWAGGVAPTPTSTNGKFDIYLFECDGVNTYGRSGGVNY